MRGDKYGRAAALSKLFEEMLARAGDPEDAKKMMDDELGSAWQVEIVVDDQGADFAPDGVELEVEEAEPKEVDEMLAKARKFAETFLMPGDNLEMDTVDFHKDEDDKQSVGSGGRKPCLSDFLRQLADQLESSGK